MPRRLSEAQRAVLEADHPRGGPHRPGARPARHGQVREARLLLCPVCGRTGGDPKGQHRLTARIRRTAGYRQIAWRDAPLTTEERARLAGALRRALVQLDEA